MMQWITDHQALLLIAWPVLSAAFSLLYTQLESMPRVHAALSFLAGFGIDLPTIWEALGRLLKGGPPGGKLTELPGPMIKGNFPKPPPDNTALRKSGTFMRRIVCACVGLLMFIVGCSWLQSPQGVATIKGGIDLAVCVLNHSTEPVPQIVTDCGASTAEDVIKILDAHKAAMVREASKDAGQ